MEEIFGRILAEARRRSDAYKERLFKGSVADWPEYQKTIGHLEGLEDVIDVVMEVKKELVEDSD